MRVILAVLAILAAALIAPSSTAAAPAPSTASAASAAAADGCYTWSGTLKEGASGDAVRQLQIRVAGYANYGEVLGLDGEFGPKTAQAVAAFQKAYGLSSDGVAGPNTFAKIYELQDDDCTPVNFTYGELNQCNSDWSGGPLSASQAKANALVSMWKLQALRHALGDQPITISSGFRSYACNDAVGGAASSRHLYGDAVDLTGVHSFCTLAKEARSHGFSEILGPGYPGHDDHTHVANDPSPYWDAPDCGI
ncbi:D-Ala-D-Ala carboxypeptidase family metallohydrolase [Solicola gregarius]|uniref:D-Ala-D-Ala carboxypeptidase family metallohydrolase n=1 Tax=Solicola gregarius TaxID=2908642 RepID=A0AA46TI49_9ACTN|nr:D-Ala-D-Ala carboxypeptidase family metallohydrolase [Solicola gregarius]UYM05731.1 D-Ala-D-Ala carboxypeptidase family metallohydrolase [Solicola gregarius]